MAKSKSSEVARSGPMGYVLFMAWIGALVFFVQQSSGFWGFIVGILQSIVWPAIVMHRVLELLAL